MNCEVDHFSEAWAATTGLRHRSLHVRALSHSAQPIRMGIDHLRLRPLSLAAQGEHGCNKIPRLGGNERNRPCSECRLIAANHQPGEMENRRVSERLRGS